jgi:uncharacterized membrane protein YfcA
MIFWAIRKSMTKMNAASSQEELKENGQQAEVERVPLRLGAAVGGMLSSVLAIGAGVIYVPILRAFGHLAPRRAIGSSLHFMMAVIPISIVTHVAFLPSDSIEQLTSDAPFIAGLALLTFLGARSGAHFGMKHLSEARIMQLFLGLIIIVAIRYVIDLSGF